MPRTKPKQKELREDRVTFRCPTTLREAIERAATQDHRSVSDWIVLALTEATRQGAR